MMKEYISKQNLLKEIKDNWPENWTDSEIEVQQQWDWRYFEAMVEELPSKSENELGEAFAEPIINTYYDTEWFDDLITTGHVICSCCEQEFRGIDLYAHKVTFAPDGFEPGRQWASEDKIFEQENKVLESIKKMHIPWKYCPYCGRKIMGWI